MTSQEPTDDAEDVVATPATPGRSGPAVQPDGRGARRRIRQPRRRLTVTLIFP